MRHQRRKRQPRTFNLPLAFDQYQLGRLGSAKFAIKEILFMSDKQVMTETSRNEQVVRILKEIKLLENNPQGLTVKELHTKLETAGIACSERTVFRDLEAIRDSHFPIENHKEDERSVWRFNAIAVISDKVRISYDELKALYISKEFLEPLKGTNFFKDITSFYDKLEQLLGHRALSELTEIGKAIGFKPKATWAFGVPQDVMDVLYAGCIEGHQIIIEYQATSGDNAFKTTTRTVCPETLYLADAGLYLVAKDLADGKTKTFSVPRIRSAKWTDQAFDATGFDVKKHFQDAIGVLTMGVAETVEIFVEEPMASYVVERKWHESQKFLRKSDGVLLQMNVRVNDELARWILSLGPQAEALKPEALVQSVATLAAGISSKYLKKAA